MPASSGVSIHNGHQNGNATHSAIRIVGNEPHGVLYHFGLSTIETDFPALFGDIKFVCTGGSAGRIANFANEFSALAGLPISQNLCKTDRFVMFKTGPVLWVNHGIGVPSLSIMLNELFTLLVHAGAYIDNNVEIIRIGTCGGIGVEPGTVIVSNGALNGALEQKHIQWIGGREVKRDAFLNARLGNDLFDTARNIDLPVERGVTFCADDFYEGQMRLDGFFKIDNEYGPMEKEAFLARLSELGVKNIEMESTGFAALTNRAKLAGAICCVVLVNRMKGDSIELDKMVYKEFENRPFKIVSNYILGRIRGQKQQKQEGNNSQ